jgi:hypothetical protein
MEFNYLPSDVQAEFASVLHEHITNAEKILKSDKCILPMLAIYADDPAENELIGLQLAGKNADTDAAFRCVIKTLSGKQFKTAVFSYSTQIVLKEDNVLYDVVKTYIMKKDGTAAIFYTPYYISGFLKKKVLYKSTIIDEITDNFFGLHTT